MPRTLYLHIGSHKTGTTSIQNFLSKNCDTLLQRGVYYPLSSNNLNLGGVLGNIDIGADDQGSSAAKRIGQVTRFILAKDAPIVIGSTESFSYLFDRPIIEAYRNSLAAHFSTIKIISYLRRQDQFAISHHQEGANPQNKPAAKLHGHATTALPEKTDLQHKYLDYDTRIGLWGDVFGDDAMVLRVYDRKALKDGDALADFMAIVGLSDLDLTVAAEKNVSMGLIQAKMGHILNDLVTDQHVKASVLKRLPEADRMLPRRDDARAFTAPYVEGNRRLNQRFHINDVPTLFSDDFSMFPEAGHEDWTEPAADAALRACAEVIEVLSQQSSVLGQEDLVAAAKALQAMKPELAAKFLAAAQTMNPAAKRIASKVARLAERRQKAETPAAAPPDKGRRAGLRAQKRQERQRAKTDPG